MEITNMTEIDVERTEELMKELQKDNPDLTYKIRRLRQMERQAQFQEKVPNPTKR